MHAGGNEIIDQASEYAGLDPAGTVDRRHQIRKDAVKVAHRIRRQGKSRSNKLYGETAEQTEIGVQRVALAGEHDAGERAGEHQVAGIERDAVLAELVGEPGDAERRMAEHAGGDAGLLDLGVALPDAADPAQIHFRSE